MPAPRSALSSAAAVPAVAALVLFVLGLYPLANRLTDGDAVQWSGHARTIWLVIGGALLATLLVMSRLVPRVLDGIFDAASRCVMRIPTPVFVGGAACFAFAASAIFAVVCFGRQPHNADEVAQLFHAKILLSGRLSLPSDANPEFFGMDNMIETHGGRWYSQFPVGGPAFLALGLLVRAAWLVNPLLLGLSVVSLYQFAKRAYDEPTARASALLLALSPFALFVAASFMNHVPVLCLATVALAQLARWCETVEPRDADRSAAIIELALGVAFTVRVSRGSAARLMVSASSCAVRLAIGAERALHPAQTSGRLDRLVRRARAFDTLSPRPPMPTECADDVRRDDAGAASFAQSFPANSMDASGRIGGDVVYVLDLAERNEELRARFGDRTWYRFGPRRSPADPAPSVIPYTPAATDGGGAGMVAPPDGSSRARPPMPTRD